jgi:HD superfamily phosphohydrolase
MSGRWPRVLRDPVHNIIRFEDDPCERLLWALIDTPEFQRLRRIKQLGMSELVFPGATHTRFAHSIGVMHTARRILESLIRKGIEIESEHRTIVLCAALLHDTGHGPFSHAFEKITELSHEAFTASIISDDSTEVNRCLREHSINLPEQVVQFLDESGKYDDPGVPAYLTQIVHSQFDADRLDYLIRDSLATGTDYGQFDMDWLIDRIAVNPDNDLVYLEWKSVHVAEAYLFARHHMYQTVYFHKATRAAEVMLRILFKRYRELLRGEVPSGSHNLPEAPEPLVKAFSGGGKIVLNDYLALDDAVLTNFFRSCAACGDPVLQRLGQGLRHRRLFKGVDVPEDVGANMVEFADESRNVLSGAGIDVEYFFVSDSSTDTPYKQYDYMEKEDPGQLFVQDHTGHIRELSVLAKPVQELRKKQTLMRYYYPVEHREAIDLAAKKLWGSKT